MIMKHYHFATCLPLAAWVLFMGQNLLNPMISPNMYLQTQILLKCVHQKQLLTIQTWLLSEEYW